MKLLKFFFQLLRFGEVAIEQRDQVGSEPAVRRQRVIHVPDRLRLELFVLPNSLVVDFHAIDPASFDFGVNRDLVLLSCFVEVSASLVSQVEVSLVRYDSLEVVVCRFLREKHPLEPSLFIGIKDNLSVDVIFVVTNLHIFSIVVGSGSTHKSVHLSLLECVRVNLLPTVREVNSDLTLFESNNRRNSCACLESKISVNVWRIWIIAFPKLECADRRMMRDLLDSDVIVSNHSLERFPENWVKRLEHLRLELKRANVPGGHYPDPLDRVSRLHRLIQVERSKSKIACYFL